MPSGASVKVGMEGSAPSLPEAAKRCKWGDDIPVLIPYHCATDEFRLGQ